MTKSNEIRKLALSRVFLYGRERIPIIAHELEVGVSTIWYWLAQSAKGRCFKDYHRRRGRSCNPNMSPLHREYLLDFLSACPFAYIWEVRNYLHAKSAFWYSKEQIRAQLAYCGITRTVLMHKAKQQSEPLRRLYRAHMRKYSKEQLVFLDETHCRPGDIRRKYGYGIRGVGAFMLSSNMQHGSGGGSCAIACMNYNGILSATAYQNETIDAQKFEKRSSTETESLPCSELRTRNGQRTDS
jgi:transposase